MSNTAASPTGHNGLSLSVTASLGAAMCRPGTERIIPQALVETADRNLYRAKDNG